MFQDFKAGNHMFSYIVGVSSHRNRFDSRGFIPSLKYFQIDFHSLIRYETILWTWLVFFLIAEHIFHLSLDDDASWLNLIGLFSWAWTMLKPPRSHHPMARGNSHCYWGWWFMAGYSPHDVKPIDSDIPTIFQLHSYYIIFPLYSNYIPTRFQLYSH